VRFQSSGSGQGWRSVCSEFLGGIDFWSVLSGCTDGHVILYEIDVTALLTFAEQREGVTRSASGVWVFRHQSIGQYWGVLGWWLRGRSLV
jgi:hypothetical protein